LDGIAERLDYQNWRRQGLSHLWSFEKVPNQAAAVEPLGLGCTA
jgi:hypothetical protein